MELNTDLRVLESVLIMIDEKKMSLEEALDKSSKRLNVEIEDNIKTIRDFLTENSLLEHNPRLTKLNVVKEIEKGVKAVQNEIHEDFINDFVTDKCSELIINNQLGDKLKAIK